MRDWLDLQIGLDFIAVGDIKIVENPLFLLYGDFDLFLGFFYVSFCVLGKEKLGIND